MKLTPRYDGPCIVLDTDTDELRTATLRQRRRAVESFGSLTDEQWRTQSRCADWSARDVVAHLVDADRFWDVSLRAGLAGEPTRMLDGFDPARTPAELASAFADVPGAAVLEQYAEVVESLCGVIESLDDAGWEALTEAPPGHLPASAMVHHALWDSWVHERDVLVPIGVDVPVERDEVLAALSYVVALGPAFAAAAGGSGSIGVEVVDLDVAVTVEMDGVARVSRSKDRAVSDGTGLRGRALDLVEVLSIRAPADSVELGEVGWIVDGLAAVFDQPVAP